MRYCDDSCSMSDDDDDDVDDDDDDEGCASNAATAAFVSIAATADFAQQHPHAPWLRTGDTTLRSV